MNESSIILQKLWEELSRIDSDLTGIIDRDDGQISLLDGAVTIRSSILKQEGQHPSLAHCHIRVSLSGDSEDPLDFCVVGVNSDRKAALEEAASSWMQAGCNLVLSYMHGRPVLDAYFDENGEELGIQNSQVYVGNQMERLNSPSDLSNISQVPLFRYASEMAPPGKFHLAKAVLEATGNGKWKRTIEIDGHCGSYMDDEWTLLPAPNNFGTVSAFALFVPNGQPDTDLRKKHIDEAIHLYVDAVNAKNTEQSVEDVLQSKGVSEGLIHRITMFTPLAFGREFLTHMGCRFENLYSRVTAEGTLIEGLHLMEEPVFARSRALSPSFVQSPLKDAFFRIGCSSAEYNSFERARKAGVPAERGRFLAPVVPDLNTRPEFFELALKTLAERAKAEFDASRQKKPWWKFW